MELEKGRWEGGRGTLAEYTDQPLLLYQLYPRDRDLGKGEFHQIGIRGGVSRVSMYRFRIVEGKLGHHPATEHVGFEDRRG